MPRIKTASEQPAIHPAKWFTNYSSAEYLSQIFLELGSRSVDLYTMRETCLRRVISDLQEREACWEDRLKHVLDFRLWDISRLRERDEHIAKPRLDLWVELTAKGNLSVKWRPRGDEHFGELTNHDIRGWQRDPYLNDWNPIGQRPNNELLYVRDLANLMRFNSHRDPWEIEMERRALFAARALTNRIVSFLNAFCETRVITDFIFVEDEDGEFVEWSIDNVANHWLESFEATYAIKPEMFLQKSFEYLNEHGHIQDEKMSRSLRKDGYAKMMPKTVRNLIEQFNQYMQWPEMRWHQPELFTLWAREGRSAEIVPFNS